MEVVPSAYVVVITPASSSSTVLPGSGGPVRPAAVAVASRMLWWANHRCAGLPGEIIGRIASRPAASNALSEATTLSQSLRAGASGAGGAAGVEGASGGAAVLVPTA
jgi:hypothetical protein